jgi:hypothetical protein
MFKRCMQRCHRWPSNQYATCGNMVDAPFTHNNFSLCSLAYLTVSRMFTECQCELVVSVCAHVRFRKPSISRLRKYPRRMQFGWQPTVVRNRSKQTWHHILTWLIAEVEDVLVDSSRTVLELFAVVAWSRCLDSHHGARRPCAPSSTGTPCIWTVFS